MEPSQPINPQRQIPSSRAGKISVYSLLAAIVLGSCGIAMTADRPRHDPPPTEKELEGQYGLDFRQLRSDKAHIAEQYPPLQQIGENTLLKTSGTTVLATYGSSSCPPQVEGAQNTDGVLTIRIQRVRMETCTADLDINGLWWIDISPVNYSSARVRDGYTGTYMPIKIIEE